MSKNTPTGNELKLNNKYKSKGIICPECKENARIFIHDYKFSIHGCKNGHHINDMLINNFTKTQYNNIICQYCNKINENNNNNIYLCLKCNHNICESCKSTHDKTHNIINYEEKTFICDLHFEPYNSYCSSCQKDLCLNCVFEHKNHEIISYVEMISNIPNKDEREKLFEKKEHIKKDINKIINKLNNLINSIDNCFDIFKNIIYINQNGKNGLNYFLLQNQNEINAFKDSFIYDINKIIGERNILNKFNNIIELYNKMNLANDFYNKNEKFNDENYNTNNKTEMPDIKDENIITDIIDDKSSDDLFINKTSKYIKDLMFISEKKEDNNYKYFNPCFMNKMLELKNDKLIFNKIYVLKDGRVIIHNNNSKEKDFFLCYIFDLKNDKCYNLNINNIKELFEMNDGSILIIFESEIMLVKIKGRNIEIIQSIKSKFISVHKLINDKILIIEPNYIFNIFIYKNRNLVFERKIILKSIKNTFNIFKIIGLSEKEIALFYGEKSFFGYKKYFCFFDLENDKKIKSFDFNDFIDLNYDIYDKILIVGNETKILAFDLVTHTIKYEKIFPIADKINSFLCLNEKNALICYSEGIRKIPFDEISYALNGIRFKDLSFGGVYKYPKSRILVKVNEPNKNYSKTLYLYG